MNKRSLPIILLSCFLALAGAAGYLLSAPEEDNPTRVLMENSGGRVVLSHLAHSAYPDVSCASCHHELQIGKASSTTSASAGVAKSAVMPPAVTPCKNCHGAVDDPAFIADHQKRYRTEDAGNAPCVSCHHARMERLADAWNHEDHKGYAGDDCQSCHHPERYERKPGKMMRIKAQKCSNCHTAKPNPLAPTTLKAAAHARCRNCHEDLFTQNNENCLSCHVRVATDPAKSAPQTRSCSDCHAPMPANMDAYHKNCMSCHDTAAKGPGVKAPCAQCHTP